MFMKLWKNQQKFSQESKCRIELWKACVILLILKRKIGNNTVLNCSVIGPSLRLNANLFHLLSRLMFNRG